MEIQKEENRQFKWYIEEDRYKRKEKRKIRIKGYFKL